MKDYKQEFIKCLKSIDYGKRPSTVFQDFLTLSTISIANTVHNSKELETQYFEVLKQYERPEKLAELLTLTVLALEEKPHDFLGEIYMRENFANKGTAQVFTPYHIAEFMADITFGNNLEKEIEEKGFIKVSDPCCGSGVMTIAMFEAIKKRGFNPQKVMWFQGTDIDITCVRMAYIQTSLLGIPGEVIHSNTITLECWLSLITPMTLFNPNMINQIYSKKSEPIKKVEIQEIKEERTKENDRKIIVEQLSIFS